MKSNSINVAVLMGGVSSEREISLRSGREVSGALQKAGYQVLDIVVDDTDVEELDAHDIDVAFIALHGTFGEDGGIQELLGNKDIPYTGSGVLASKLAMNKIEAKKIFVNNGLSTPDYAEVSRFHSDSDLTEIIKLIGMPVVVKPAMEGSSIGVKMAKDKNELRLGIEDASKYGDCIIVERYIEGRELTVGILIDNPLPIVEIKPGACFYNYCSKYQDHQTRYLTSVDMAHEVYKNIQLLAKQAHTVLGCRDISRVDIILGNDGYPYLLEVNTIPGFTKRSLFPMAAKAANIEFVQLCDILVTEAVNRENKSLANRNNLVL